MKTLCLFFLCFICCAHSYEKIDKIGKIIYSNETGSYYFIYLVDNNRIASHQLAIKNSRELKTIKEFVNKSVRIDGGLEWERGNAERFWLKEQLTIFKMEIFELDRLAFDSRKVIGQDRLISHTNEKRARTNRAVIQIPDNAANSILASGAIAVGILAGPLSLIPAAFWGISQFL